MRFIYIMVAPLVMMLTFAITSCNGDVFVPDTRPSVAQVTLSGDGDSTVVAYNPHGLKRVKLQHLFSFPIQVLDKNGQLAAGDIAPADIGRVVLKSTDIDMEFEVIPSGIKIKVNENMYLGEVNMFLDLDYGYTCHSVEIVVKQCSPYDIVDVVYDMDSIDVFGPWAEDASSTFVICNTTDSDMRITQYPFKDEYAEFKFDMKASVRLLTTIDEKPMDVEIPTFKEGVAGLYGRTVSLSDAMSVGNRISFMPTVDWNMSRILVAPPHSNRRYYRFVEHMELRVPVRIVIKSPVSGNLRDLTGTLTVKEPTGFFYGYENLSGDE